ncbi:MAG: folylpolyglutamate synthase/dihydrofolate synthase family protein [Eubacteriales bacterium]
MTIEESLAYIHSTCWKGSVPGLSRSIALLEAMGNPQNQLKFVHVAGTNGKGSTAAMVASVLQTAGYRTGLYTSPYIHRFHERMQVNGQQISDDDLIAVTEFVKPFAQAMEDSPTEFELVSAIAFGFFARQNCDIVVLEVGMGGELDSTNVILPPEVAVICNIGLDHTDFLGNTLEEVASAKAGIIKAGCPVVVYETTESVRAVFQAKCDQVGATLYDTDFSKIVPISQDLSGQIFDCGDYKGLELPLLGIHQQHNCTVALKILEILASKGYNLPEATIRQGLSQTKWPGRFEVLGQDPLFLVDGGHNPQCIEALVENIRTYLQGQELVVLTGVMADKDFGAMYEDVAPYVRHFVTVTPDNPRAMQAQELADYLNRFSCPTTACDTVADGVKTAMDLAGTTGVVLTYGSLYMLGEVQLAVDTL